MIHPCLFFFCSLFVGLQATAQFAPPAGQPGTTAMAQDSSAFVAWATGCTVQRGPQDISDPGLGDASTGEAISVIGPAGNNDVVSLGDGGSAILTFAAPIVNGPGRDFAVFENSFSDDYLELAFVEVSSDGVHFVRFPATSNTVTDEQVGSFGTIDATRIDNLAGKYRGGYGTPFDLEELSGQPGLDVNAVTHVKVVDVVGCIRPDHATQDANGHIVNDPWSTPFASGGFDLDAVGVVHTNTTGLREAADERIGLAVHPVPLGAEGRIAWTQPDAAHVRIVLTDLAGRTMVVLLDEQRPPGRQTARITTGDHASGPYFITLTTPGATATRQVLLAP